LQAHVAIPTAIIILPRIVRNAIEFNDKPCLAT
jgi:hypothetical protein